MELAIKQNALQSTKNIRNQKLVAANQRRLCDLNSLAQQPADDSSWAEFCAPSRDSQQLARRRLEQPNQQTTALAAQPDPLRTYSEPIALRDPGDNLWRSPAGSAGLSPIDHPQA